MLQTVGDKGLKFREEVVLMINLFVRVIFEKIMVNVWGSSFFFTSMYQPNEIVRLVYGRMLIDNWATAAFDLPGKKRRGVKEAA